MRLPDTFTILAFLSTSAIVFTAIMYYLENMNMLVSDELENMKSISCHLILEGFLIKPETDWGDISEEILQ